MLVVAQVGVAIGGRSASAPDANEAPDGLLVDTADVSVASTVASSVTIRAICLAAKEHTEIVLAYTCRRGGLKHKYL